MNRMTACDDDAREYAYFNYSRPPVLSPTLQLTRSTILDFFKMAISYHSQYPHALPLPPKRHSSSITDPSNMDNNVNTVIRDSRTLGQLLRDPKVSVPFLGLWCMNLLAALDATALSVAIPVGCEHRLALYHD